MKKISNSTDTESAANSENENSTRSDKWGAAHSVFLSSVLASISGDSFYEKQGFYLD
jgi:hypothetical protein